VITRQRGKYLPADSRTIPVTKTIKVVGPKGDLSLEKLKQYL
jgi:hypothetical protein